MAMTPAISGWNVKKTCLFCANTSSATLTYKNHIIWRKRDTYFWRIKVDCRYMWFHFLQNWIKARRRIEIHFLESRLNKMIIIIFFICDQPFTYSSTLQFGYHWQQKAAVGSTWASSTMLRSGAQGKNSLNQLARHKATVLAQAQCAY